MLKKNIVYLSGGLGNQMFQYAFARALYLKYNIPFEINTDFYRRRFEDQTSRDLGLNLFKLKFKESRFTNLGRVCLGIKKILLKLIPSLNFSFFNEENFEINNINFKKNNFFQGYWQNHKYFESIKDDLKVDFGLEHNISNLNLNSYNQIINSNSVCIHVRRKDYLGTDYEVVDVNYYKKAFDIIKSKYSKLNFFIFSDDIKWCKENLTFIPNSTFCSYTLLNDFHLMTLCKHFIIPNSTFCWWAAYLSNNDNNSKTVIIPSKWHKTNNNLLKNGSPEKWIILK